MLMRKEPFVSPIERYLQSGDTLLSPSKLIDIHDRVSGSPKVTNIMLSADVCIDVASQVSEPDEWIETSKDHLGSIIDDSDYLFETGSTTSFYRSANTYARAHIRLAEIANWDLVVHGEQPTHNYHNLLQAGANILPHIGKENDTVISMVIEYIPLLLGARAKYTDYSKGWLGRMALLREDCRLMNQKGRNLNWDVGICGDSSGSDFQSPEHRVQVAAKRKQGANRYDTAGIKTIIARKLGFIDVVGVINGCLNEEGLEVYQLKEEDSVMESDELDIITQNIQNKLMSSD
jgi:hypothetical protein